MASDSSTPYDADDDRQVVRRAADGDRAAAIKALDCHRARLRRMVEARLDCRVRERVDPSDVVQDGFVDAVARLSSYLTDPTLPLFLWLRWIVGERLATVHRDHLGAEIGAAGRIVYLYRGPMPSASSAALAAHLLGRETTPIQAAVRAERLLRIQEVLNGLDPIDREILSLRHFEELTHAEAARVLDMDEASAAKHYIHALKHLMDVLNAL